MFKIHKTLGHGLLESVYEEALCYELTNAGLKYQRQKEIEVVYEGMKNARRVSGGPDRRRKIASRVEVD